MARRSDIPSIQRCNLATLPENYNSNFYLHHLRTWPELALVMEYVPSSKPTNYYKPQFNYDNTEQRNGFSNYNPKDESMIIGYVLGKVDQVPVRPEQEQPRIPSPKPKHTLPRSRVSENYGIYPPFSRSFKRHELLGHVTSLAILHNYRRRGLAEQLMNQLHHHMTYNYNADAVGLHVRVSNKAATKLYIQTLGYSIADVIKGYYQDGEDAYFMRKEFVHHHAYQEERPRGRFWNRNKGKNNSLALPRRIDLVEDKRNADFNARRRGTLSFVSNDAMYYQYDSE